MMSNKKESADYMELIKRKKFMIGFDYENEKECLAAVKQRGFALEYVKEQTPEICLAAMKNSHYCIIYIDDLHFLLDDNGNSLLNYPDED